MSEESQAENNSFSSDRETPLSPAAQRALAEAQARRAATAEQDASLPDLSQREINGPSGPEPTRFGDWERKGIASDF